MSGVIVVSIEFSPLGKPAAEGTGIPYDINPSQSSTNTTLPNVNTVPYQNHEIILPFMSTEIWDSVYIFKAEEIKCCKEIEITAPPNE